MQEIVKHLVWLLVHRLITNFLKSVKGLGCASCNLCVFVCENIMHVMRDYLTVMRMYKALVPNNIDRDFFNTNNYEYIMLNMLLHDRDRREWSNV